MFRTRKIQCLPRTFKPFVRLFTPQRYSRNLRNRLTPGIRRLCHREHLAPCLRPQPVALSVRSLWGGIRAHDQRKKAAEYAPDRDAQANSHLVAEKIARLTLATVVPAHAYPTAPAAERLFDRRHGIRIRAFGAPRTCVRSAQVENQRIDMLPTDAVATSFLAIRT